MSYAAVEVELRDGRVTPRRGETLPAAARALLVVLESEASSEVESATELFQTLDLIRARQSSRGHSPRSAEAVRDQLRRERQNWD